MPDLETSLSYCTYCPKLCRHACPVSSADTRETVVPQTKMATLARLRSGDEKSRPPWIGDAGGIPPQAAAALYACTGCLACTTACHHGITPGLHLLAGRAAVERDGIGHPALRELPERVRAKATTAAREARAAVPPTRIRAEGEVALLPGCDRPQAAATTLALLERVGAGYVGLAEVSLGCGGYPLLAGGFPEQFRLHAETLARELQGYSRVAVSCPACAWAMQKEYPAHGVALRPQVMHTVELLDRFAERLPLPVGDGEERPAVFYHDPCYLGRHRGVYEAPRRLLRKVVGEVREFSRNRAEAECSGGGGVLPITAPATAAAIASQRLVEVHEAGLRTVVTACPTCQRQLGREGVNALDLVEVLEEATRPRRSDA